MINSALFIHQMQSLCQVYLSKREILDSSGPFVILGDEQKEQKLHFLK